MPEPCTHYHWTCFYERLSSGNGGPSMFQAYCQRCGTMSGFHFSMFDAEHAMPVGIMQASGNLQASAQPATEESDVEVFTCPDE